MVDEMKCVYIWNDAPRYTERRSTALWHAVGVLNDGLRSPFVYVHDVYRAEKQLLTFRYLDRIIFHTHRYTHDSSLVLAS